MGKSYNKSITCPYSSQRYHAARNGETDYARFDKSTSDYIYFGVPVELDGYSSDSVISNIKLTYDFRSTTTTTNGSLATDNGKTWGKALLGNSGMFTLSGNDITSYNGADAASSASSTWSGVENSIDWASSRNGGSDIASGTISGSWKVSGYSWVGAQIFLQNTSTSSLNPLHLYLRRVTLNYTLTVKSRIKFFDGSTQISQSVLDFGDAVTAPSVTAPTGYKLKGWRKDSTSGTLYTSLDACDGHDVSYYAEWELKNYNVHTCAVNQNGGSINAPSGQTGDATYTLNGSAISVTAPSTDYDINNNGSVKYVFSYWSMTDSAGRAVENNVTTNTMTYGALTTNNIETLFSNGDTITATAHYRQVYDLTVGFDASYSNNSADGLSSVTITHVTLNGSGNTVETTTTVQRANLVNGLTTVRGYTNVFTVRYYLSNTAQHTDDFVLAHVNPSNMSGFSDATNPTPSTSRFTVDNKPLNYNVTATTSTMSFTVGILRNYYALNIIYNGADVGDTPSNIVKVYKIEGGNTAQLSVADLSHIPRGVNMLIEARDTNDGTRMTKYTADLSNASSGITLGNSAVVNGNTRYYTATLCPTVITGSNTSYSVTANLHQAFCNMREIVRTTNADTGVITDADPIDTAVRRTSTYTFSYTARGTYKIGSASLSRVGESAPEVTWSTSDLNNGTLTYTYPASGSDGILDDMVFIVSYIPNITAYMYLTVGSCVYGNVDATSAVLRSQYATTKLAIAGVVEDASYEVTRIQYQWYVTNSGNVTSAASALFDIDITSWVRSAGSTSATNVFAPAQAVAIPYRNTASSDNLSALDENSYATCKIFVTFRKNIIYHSSRQNNTTTVKRPSALYYTPVGGTPQPVIAVYVQTSTHTTPILLFGDVQ